MNRTRGLIGLSIGFGYNRIADFNYDYSYQRSGQDATVADVYARQMVWNRISKNDFYDDGGQGNWNWDRIAPSILECRPAYRAYMIDQTGENAWAPTWIGNGADITHYTTVKSRGSAGEFAMSVGANIEKQTLRRRHGGHSEHPPETLRRLRRRLPLCRPEHGTPYGTDPSLDYQLLYAKLNQAMIINGAGVNLKVGLVYRPIPGLRIGAAFHTPTYYSLDRKYQSSAASMAFANRNTDPNVRPDSKGYISSGTENMTTPLLYDENPDGWSFTTPARLLLGASYTFGSRAILSVDYERDWYNGIRMSDNPIGTELKHSYKQTFRDMLKGSNIVRAGAEFKALPGLALRAGFGYSGSMLRDENTIFAQPAIKKTVYYSAGIGLALSRVCTFDLAYQYMKHTTTDYYLFYVSETEDTPRGPQDMFAESSLYRTDFARHNVALSLSFRF